MSLPLIFEPDRSSHRRRCLNISITFDENVEDMETFFVILNTADTAVQVMQSISSITIQDSSSEFKFFLSCCNILLLHD